MHKPLQFVFAFFCYFTIPLTMSACLDSSTEVSHTDFQQDYVKAQSRQYARGLEQYSLQSVHLLTNSANWLSGAYATANAGGVIDLVALGGNGGVTEDYAKSGFCVTNPADPKELTHITWFESADDDQFILKGIGTNSTSLLVAAMATRTAENSLAVYVGNNNLKISGTNENLTLPAQCQDFDIPAGSPVLISRMDLPALPADAVTKTEITTIACEAGKVGHYLLSLDVTTLPNGTRLAGGQTLAAGASLPPVSNVQANTVWTVIEDNCKDEIILTSIATQDMKFNSIELNMAAANNVGRNIEKALNNVKCRQAALERGDEQDETGQNHNSEREEYDTCSDTVDVVDINNVGDVRVTLDRIEAHTTPCGGSTGTFYDVIDGQIGTITHDIWRGNATYSREIYIHEATSIINARVDREMKESWYGESIYCQRQEDLNITCNTGYPALSSFTITDDRGFNYRRNNSINGWADSSNLVPNDPANPAWNFRADESGCGWLQTENWDCTEGTLVQTGERQRTHRSSQLGQALTVGSWELVQPSICEETRYSIESCPADQVGDIRLDQQRIYTSNVPGTGSWGPWRTIDSTNTCANDPTEITSTLPAGVRCGGIAGSEGGKYCTDGYRTVYDWGMGTIEYALRLLQIATEEEWEVFCDGEDNTCRTIPPEQRGDRK